jgi:hypothetical protein
MQHSALREAITLEADQPLEVLKEGWLLKQVSPRMLPYAAVCCRMLAPPAVEEAEVC